MVETMMEWKVLPAGGDTSLASAIYHCLNFQQGLEKLENLRPKLIFATNFPGGSIIEFVLINVSCYHDTKNEYQYIFRIYICCVC